MSRLRIFFTIVDRPELGRLAADYIRAGLATKNDILRHSLQSQHFDMPLSKRTVHR
jgi:hypothetical protein